MNKDPAYFWYTATFNDTPETIAKKFSVQVGGIYELNSLLAGQEISVGTAYKIPKIRHTAKIIAHNRTCHIAAELAATTFGNSPWTSYCW